MSSITVASAVLILLLLAYLLLLLSFGVGLVRARRITRAREATDRAVQTMGTWLVVAVTSQEPARREQARSIVRDQLTDLSSAGRTMSLFALSQTVGQEEGAILRDVCEELGILDRAEAEASAGGWATRLLAIRLMASLRVPSPLLRAHLDDPHPAVRAQCAQWAVSDPTEETLARLAQMVEDPNDRCRFEAQDALARLGPIAADNVLDLLRSDRPRQVDAGLRIAALTNDPRYTETLRTLLATGEPEQQVLAAKSLSTADGPALEALQRLLGSHDPMIRQSAVEVLAADRDWHQASTIAPLLADPSRTVRRTAGLALLRLGAPGLIMLRQRSAQERDAPGTPRSPSGPRDELAGQRP